MRITDIKGYHRSRSPYNGDLDLGDRRGCEQVRRDWTAQNHKGVKLMYVRVRIPLFG